MASKTKSKSKKSKNDSLFGYYGFTEKEAKEYPVVSGILKQLTPKRIKQEVEKYALHYSVHIFPIVKKKLILWHDKASRIKNSKKAIFACNSIRDKAKHPIANCILTSSLKLSYLDFILDKYIALSLMLDYLDDVLDKSGERCFKRVKNMQQAMVDALKTRNGRLAKYCNSQMLDVPYLEELVYTVNEKIDILPSYQKVFPYMIKAMEDFTKTQIHSILPPKRRKILAKKWAQENFAKKLGLKWFEHQAVQASPLRAYALLWLSTRPDVTINQIKLINNAYIWFGGINVLGDQLNDIENDLLNNEVNQISEYRDKEKAKEGILKMVAMAHKESMRLPNPHFHLFILTTLINLYMQPLLGTDWHDLAHDLCKQFNGGGKFVNKIIYNYDRYSFFN